jgi:alkaline phosphatase
MRNKVGTYNEAGFPNYPAPDAEGYPDKVDVSRRLRLVFGSYPDHYDTYAPHMEGEFVPAIRNAEGVMVANDKYKDVPGAVLRQGNLPNKGAGAANSGVHSGDDVILTAAGPGADKVHGQLENTDLFRIMAEALALAPQGKTASSKVQKK